MNLDDLRVASPCTASWDEMLGDDRVRFCSLCSKNVYNISAMTREEATRLIITKEGKICARFYRRKDGTVLTSDCPVGRIGWRKRLAVRVACVVALVVSPIMPQYFRSLFAVYEMLPSPHMGKPTTGVIARRNYVKQESQEQVSKHEDVGSLGYISD